MAQVLDTCKAYAKVLFEYQTTRAATHPETFLSGFKGFLHTDAFAGYEKVEDITRTLCWSHVRRKLIDSIPLDSSRKEILGSKGVEGRKFCNDLFQIE